MHSRLRATLAALGTTVAAVAMSTAGTTTAHASERSTTQDVPGLSICTDAYFSNPQYYCHMNMGWAQWDVRDAANQIGWQWQDSISSIRNLTGRNMCFYEHNGYSGDYFMVRAGYEVANLAGTKFNDAISSWRPC